MTGGVVSGLFSEKKREWGGAQASVNTNTCGAKAGKICRGATVAVLAFGLVLKSAVFLQSRSP